MSKALTPEEKRVRRKARRKTEREFLRVLAQSPMIQWGGKTGVFVEVQPLYHLPPGMLGISRGQHVASPVYRR